MSLHALAAELGVSRSPVHHALTRLVFERLVTVRPRHGLLRHTRHGEGRRRGLRRPARARAPRRRADGGPPDDAALHAFEALLRDTAAAISHEQWDSANATFHEHQIDLAGNALLSRFYREFSVNLMMQVIRAGRVEGHANLVTEHGRIVGSFARGGRVAAEWAIRTPSTPAPDRARRNRAGGLRRLTP